MYLRLAAAMGINITTGGANLIGGCNCRDTESP
jgi:hypothetical protein